MTHKVKNERFSFSSNLYFARKVWGQNSLSPVARGYLRELSKHYGFSVAAGDLQLLDGRWYVTHSGLLRLSVRCACAGIKTLMIARLCDPAANRWFFRATVYKSRRSLGFVGFGDADPFNVSPLVKGAEMRIAETRAVNRALRKAYGIGLCSVEELGCACRCCSEMAGTANSVDRFVIFRFIIYSRAACSAMTQRKISSPYALGVTKEPIYDSFSSLGLRVALRSPGLPEAARSISACANQGETPDEYSV
jgi:hypothetical protein